METEVSSLGVASVSSFTKRNTNDIPISGGQSITGIGDEERLEINEIESCLNFIN